MSLDVKKQHQNRACLSNLKPHPVARSTVRSFVKELARVQADKVISGLRVHCNFCVCVLLFLGYFPLLYFAFFPLVSCVLVSAPRGPTKKALIVHRVTNLEHNPGAAQPKALRPLSVRQICRLI